MFLCLVLIALSLCLNAQSRIEVSGTDTSAVIPIRQLRMANAKFVELKECREENDSLFSQIRSYTVLTNNLRSSITDLKEANRLNEVLISDKQKIIMILDTELNKATRKSKIFKIQRNCVAAVCLVLIGKILIFK